jgi:hypothetical protein
MNLLNSSSSLSKSSNSSLTLPILAIFYKSGSFYIPLDCFFNSLKISAVCDGPLDHIICKVGKCKVSSVNLDMILAGLTSPPVVGSYAMSNNLNGIDSSNSINSTGLL